MSSRPRHWTPRGTSAQRHHPRSAESGDRRVNQTSERALCTSAHLMPKTVIIRTFVPTAPPQVSRPAYRRFTRNGARRSLASGGRKRTESGKPLSRMRPRADIGVDHDTSPLADAVGNSAALTAGELRSPPGRTALSRTRTGNRFLTMQCPVTFGARNGSSARSYGALKAPKDPLEDTGAAPERPRRTSAEPWAYR